MKLTTDQLTKMDSWVIKVKPTKGAWKVDPVLLHNQKIHLAYKSTPDGPYVMLTPSMPNRLPTLDIGIFEHAFPNVTDGIFQPDLTLRSENMTDLRDLLNELMS